MFKKQKEGQRGWNLREQGGGQVRWAQRETGVRETPVGHHESNGKLLEGCRKTTDITQFEFLKITLAEKQKKWFGRAKKIGSWKTSQEANNTVVRVRGDGA